MADHGSTLDCAHSWIGSAGSSRLDLRSDVTTTPTASMLRAINSCSLQDDVWQEDKCTKDLEQLCASLTGKDAALFVLSGTMGNQLALRSLLAQPPHAIVCDHRAHIITSEAGGLAILTSAMTTTVVPHNGLYLTLEDIKMVFCPDDSIIGCPTGVISLENTLHGTVMPLKEIIRISAFAKRHGIKMHCDGARLWEAVAAGAGGLEEFCACFDTVSLCFSKGLGSPVGSIIVGDTSTLRKARHVRKAIGGGLRQPGFITATAMIGVKETYQGGLLQLAQATARKVEQLWKDIGGRTRYPVETNIVWLNLEELGIPVSTFVELGSSEGLKVKGERLVIHYQISQNEEDVLQRLERVFTKAWSVRDVASSSQAIPKTLVY